MKKGAPPYYLPILLIFMISPKPAEMWLPAKMGVNLIKREEAQIIIYGGPSKISTRGRAS